MDSKRSLSEISHLFLSDVRNHAAGPVRPTRIPPGQPREPREARDHSIDMTPEEFAASLEADPQSSETSFQPVPAPTSAQRTTAVLFSHLLEQRSHGVRQYARHLAASSEHVGLIEVDSTQLSLSCFEANGGPAATPITINAADARQMSQTLAELSFDVSRWLIALPNPRSHEARDLLRQTPHWLLLTTTEHEDVVATYRTLKGLADLGKPRLSLLVLGARDAAQADAVFHKLDAVTRQFLGCALESESALGPAQNVTEHAVLNCRVSPDRPQTAPAPHWNVLSQFIARAPESESNRPMEHAATMKINPMDTAPSTEPKFVMPAAAQMPSASSPEMSIADSRCEVIDLPADFTEQAILEAVVRQGGAEGRWVQCPIHPPMCPSAVLAVDRDHRLVLLAIAGRGLSQFRNIGLALRWMAENNELIRMALPQLAVDASASPAVRLLVDHDDLSTAALQSMLQTETITIQTYRRLKWGPKTGLLLEAA